MVLTRRLWLGSSSRAQSSHREHAPESDFPTHHMFVSLRGFSQGEPLNHAVDVVDLRECNGLFAIECVA